MNEDLVAAFPNAALAAGFVEMFICGVPSGYSESCWDMLLRANPGINPREMAEKIATVTEKLKLDRPHDPEIPPLARQQMDHPDFLRYVAGKMGAM